MNIVVLSHRVPFPPIKGEKIRTYHQLESLRKAGHDITLLCPLHEPEDADLLQQYASLTGIRTFSAAAGRGWWRMLVSLFTGRSLSVGRFHIKKLQSQLHECLRTTPADVLYCTSSAMAEYAFIAGKESGLPKCRLMVDFMDLDSDKWRRFSDISAFPMSWVYRYEACVLGKYEEKVQQHTEACLFVSQAEVDLFKTRLSNPAANVRVIGNGVDLSDFYPPAESQRNEPLTLLFTGVMDYLPNEDAICWFVEHVWDLVKEKYPQVSLVVAGMKPGQRVLDLKSKGNIVVTGYVDEMLPYYHNAHVFVAPFQIARGVQNKILQAFACGLPVVTTPIGAEGIDGIDEEHFLVADSPEHFAVRIDELVRDRRKYQHIAASARELVMENYDWQAKNRSLIDLMSAESRR